VPEEGKIIEIGGQRYLVVSVDYEWEDMDQDPWIKRLELRGIKDEN